jgi:16S rRNA processing protein RimM
VRPATKRASTLASNSSTEPERFVVGRLGRPHGLDGYLGLYIDEEDAAGLAPGVTVYLESRPYVLRAVRRVDRGYQVAFEGVDDMMEAEALRGLDVEVSTRRTLGDDEYWPGDLIGLEVRAGGEPVGLVVDVVFGAAQERLLVETIAGTRFEVPFVGELVPVVDLVNRWIEIVALPGLIEP